MTQNLSFVNPTSNTTFLSNFNLNMLSKISFTIFILFLAFLETALAQGSKNKPNDDDWQPPMEEDDGGKGTIETKYPNANCQPGVTGFQCFKPDLWTSITHNTKNLTIECDAGNVCSIPFDFNKKDNEAGFRVNCLNYVGKPTGPTIDVELYGGKTILPIGVVYGSAETHGEGVRASWGKTVKRWTDPKDPKYNTIVGTRLYMECLNP